MSEVRYGGYVAFDNQFASCTFEHAQRVFADEGLTDASVGVDLDVIFGPSGRPWASVHYGAGMGAFSAHFLHEQSGNGQVGAVLNYGFYTAQDRYLPFMREMSEAQVEQRSGQMFMSHIDVRYWNDEGTDSWLQVSVLLHPDGSAQRRERRPPWNSQSKFVETKKEPWPGLDPETCWVPVPTLGELESLLVPEREQLAVLDLEMPQVRPRA